MLACLRLHPNPPMSIMSDRWITRMAEQHGMIEPFEGRQVRAGVISYGVSSYGYDMRVAREFKIFTNVLSSIVDPKNFDPKSFVEFEGDICIVPRGYGFESPAQPIMIASSSGVACAW